LGASEDDVALSACVLSASMWTFRGLPLQTVISPRDVNFTHLPTRRVFVNFALGWARILEAQAEFFLLDPPLGFNASFRLG